MHPAVHPTPRAPRRSAGAAIAAIVAIPFTSVTSVALLADVASGHDHNRLWAGLGALVVGVVVGLASLHVVRAARSGFSRVSMVRLRLAEIPDAVLAAADPGRRIAATQLVPVAAVVSTAVRRRGPPVVSF